MCFKLNNVSNSSEKNCICYFLLDWLPLMYTTSLCSVMDILAFFSVVFLKSNELSAFLSLCFESEQLWFIALGKYVNDLVISLAIQHNGFRMIAPWEGGANKLCSTNCYLFLFMQQQIWIKILVQKVLFLPSFLRYFLLPCQPLLKILAYSLTHRHLELACT